MNQDTMAFIATMTIIGGGLFLGFYFLRRVLEQRHERQMHQAPDALLSARLDRIEAIVETTALEVERISEANRFMSKLMAEGGRGAIPSPKQPERVITPH